VRGNLIPSEEATVVLIAASMMMVAGAFPATILLRAMHIMRLKRRTPISVMGPPLISTPGDESYRFDNLSTYAAQH
jgi:hypothetical protein